jgi:hypothetical protein
VDPLGLCSSNGIFLVPGACDFGSKSWVSQAESTLQSQEGGGFSITNGLKAVADYGAAIGNVVTSTVTLGHVKISPPYCGFAWASDVGTGFGFVALAALTGGSGGAADVADGAETVEEAEAGAQASDAGLFRSGSPIEGTSGPPSIPTMENVSSVAARSGVDLSGVSVDIVDDPELAGKGLYGWTDGTTIQLYPDAFANDETLSTTLGHEYTHVLQIAESGPTLDSASAGARELEAYESEGNYLQTFRSSGG